MADPTAATAILGSCEVVNFSPDDAFESSLTKKPRRTRPTIDEQSGGELFNTTFNRTSGNRENDANHLIMTAQELNGTMKRRKKKRSKRRHVRQGSDAETGDYEDDFEDDEQGDSDVEARNKTSGGVLNWSNMTSVEVEHDKGFSSTIGRQNSKRSSRKQLQQLDSPSQAILSMHPNNHQHPDVRQVPSGLPPLADRSNSHAGRRGNSTHGERTTSTSPQPQGHTGYASDVSLPDITKTSRRSRSNNPPPGNVNLHHSNGFADM